MAELLASAERTAAPDSRLLLALICLGIVACVGAMAMVPLALAARRRHAHRDAIRTITIFWAIFAIVVAIFALVDQFKRTREQMFLIQSGYLDPTQIADHPQWELPTAAALLLVYGVLIAWAISIRSPPSNPRSN